MKKVMRMSPILIFFFFLSPMLMQSRADQDFDVRQHLSTVSRFAVLLSAHDHIDIIAILCVSLFLSI